MSKLLLSSFLLSSTFYLDSNSSYLNVNAIYNNHNNYIFKNLNSIMFEENKINSPSIESKLEEGIEKIKYNAFLADYSSKSYNYLVFYKKNIDGSIEELFRHRIINDGSGEITNKKLLNKINNNKVIFARTESFSSDGNQEKIKFSKNSAYNYTPKNYKLNILEDENLVYKDTILYKGEVNNNKVKIPISELTDYKVDKYYTYSGSTIKYDNNDIKVIDGYIEIPYNTESLDVNLAKNLSNWKNININYPNFYSDNNMSFKVKSGIGFKTFLKNNSKEFLDIQEDNYKLDGYYIDNVNIYSYDKIIKEDLKIDALFKTKITINFDNKKDIIFMKTGEDLSKLDVSKYSKKNYDIESFSIKNNSTGEINTVNNLSELKIDDSLTITINYKEQLSTIKVRQDEYNSRFGLVDESIKDKDIEFSKNKKSGELLEQLRSKITPNAGYEVKFRVNKKEVDEDSYFKEDVFLEIYFKKIPDNWVNIKFVGEGIDKFLSDGQEILVGSYLNNINLPTSTGVNKRLLGWKSNHDYTINIDGNILLKSKDELLQLNDIQNIITEKNKNLIFTAEYFEPHYIEIINDSNGVISIGKDNKIFIENGGSLKNSLNDLIYIKPRSHYIFSHFTSTLPVLIDEGNGMIKVIPIGQKISLQDFYKIIPNNNLTFNSHFVFYNNFLDYKNSVNFNIIENSSKYDILNRNHYNTGINNDILGPFIFLK